MQCPIDDTTLQLFERQGVEIDYCPQCRGVWLDRGELDKLIQRADNDTDHDDRSRGHDREHTPDRSPKKKERWLSELFDVEG
jgi:Zn-finger nucleic acid-binding protein